MESCDFGFTLPLGVSAHLESGYLTVVTKAAHARSNMQGVARPSGDAREASMWSAWATGWIISQRIAVQVVLLGVCSFFIHCEPENAILDGDLVNTASQTLGLVILSM